MARDERTGKMTAPNRLGERHGIYVVIGDAGKTDKRGSKIWIARCECGDEFEIASSKMSRVVSCGCRTKRNAGQFKAVDLEGEMTRGIVALKKTPERSKSGYVMYDMRCSFCGKTFRRPSYDFTRNTVHCDCAEWKANFAKPTGRKQDPDNSSNVNLLMKGYRKSAKERKLCFALTKKQFKSLIEADCFYCGKKPQRKNQKSTCHGEYYSNGIDRVDNSLGYTIDNCVTCCKECNFGKGTMSKEDFLAWVKRVYEHTFSDC